MRKELESAVNTESELKTGVVITAAGLSSRMGVFKPLLPYKNTTMIRFLVDLFREAGAAPVLVVTGYRSEELREHLADREVLLVENPRYAQTEMFDSIKLGLQRLAGLCHRAAFVPVDVPDLSLALLQRVFCAEGKIVRPVYHGRPGHPVVLDAGLIPAVCAYTGERGLRGALESLDCGITELEAENDGIYNDIDTMEDYRSLIRKEDARTVYLVRHGAVEFPGGEKRCIGRTDLPLSRTGRRQALRLGEYFRDKEIEAVYASPLKRALDTAQLAAGEKVPVRVREGLTELYMGSWENQPLGSLHKKLEDEAPGGEERSSGLRRFSETVDQIIAETRGNVVIVSHAGVICAYLSERMNTPLETSRGIRQPYCGLNIFAVRTGSRPKLLEYGVRADQVPEEREIRELFHRRGTPRQVIRHCEAVAAEAKRIAGALNGKGMKLDEDLIWASALLHDVERLQKGHDRKGGQLLLREGYPRIADIIRQHHELDRDLLDEAAVVFYADKRYREDERVSLAERFADSAGKRNMSPEAQMAHARRFRQAQAIEKQIYEMLGMDTQGAENWP